MLSRRAALQGGSAAMAIAATLAIIPLRTKAEDGEVFGIVEEWHRELEFEKAALTRLHGAIQSLMPPGLQVILDALQSAEGRAAFWEIVKRPEIEALSAEHDRRQDTPGPGESASRDTSNHTFGHQRQDEGVDEDGAEH